MDFELGELLYSNPMASAADVADWRLEGDASISFPRQRMRLEQAYERDMDAGRHANFIYWCPVDFPADIAVSWDFKPLSDAGLAMFWSGVKGRNGADLFDPSLAPRDGNYPQYFDGDINALHVSYYRRNPTETPFRTCNLRKSHGFHLVAQGGDPLPDARDALDSYRIQVFRRGPLFVFCMNDLELFRWEDDGVSTGPVNTDGKIGFRQMAGLIAEYANLEVRAIGG